MNRIILNGAGAIDLDIENQTLSPATVQVAMRLWLLVLHHPQKAVRRLDECELFASLVTGLSLQGWSWVLPLPLDYTPCPCCVC